MTTHDKTARDLAAYAISYAVPQPEGAHPFDRMTVERRAQRDGTMRWVVMRAGDVLSKDGEWLYEPIPSSRTDDHMRQTRFASLAEAWSAAQAVAAREAAWRK